MKKARVLGVVVVIMVCLVAILLLNNSVFSKNQNIVVQHYDMAKDDDILCQFYVENGNDKAIVYQVINKDGGLILVQKDVNQKSSLESKDLELMINILQ